MRPERARRDVLLIAEIVVGEDEAEAINLAIVALRVIREAITLDQSQLVCVGEGEKREKKKRQAVQKDERAHARFAVVPVGAGGGRLTQSWSCLEARERAKVQPIWYLIA